MLWHGLKLLSTGSMTLDPPGGCRLRSATTRALPGVTQHKLQSDLHLLLVFGLEVPGRGQALNQSQLLVVPHMGPLSEM